MVFYLNKIFRFLFKIFKYPGNNAIVVNFGATLELNEKDLDNAEESIRSCKVLVTSRVIKESTALYSLKLAKKHDCKPQNFL